MNRSSIGHAICRKRVLGWLCIGLLGICVLALCRGRMRFTFSRDELWVVEGVLRGQRNITPPLLYAALRGMGLDRTSPEAVWRIPSLIATVLGVCCLPVYASLRNVSLRGRLICWTTALMLLFCSPVMIYGSFVKSYSIEVLVSSIALVLLMEGQRRIHVAGRGFWVLFWAVTAFLSMALYSTVFSVVTITFCLAVLAVSDSLRERTGPPLVRLFRSAMRGALKPAASGSAAVLVFLACYFLFLRNGVTGGTINNPEDLDTYWDYAFWDGTPAFIIRMTLSWFGHLLNMTRFGWAVFAAQFALFAFSCIATRKVRGLLVLLPSLVVVLLVLCASRFRLYPYGEARIMLFVAPFVFHGFSAMAVANYLSPWRTAKVVTGITAVFLVVFAFRGVVIDPYSEFFMGRDDRAPLYTILSQDLQTHENTSIFAGDGVYDLLRFYLPHDADHVFPIEQATQRVWSRGWLVNDPHSLMTEADFQRLRDSLGSTEEVVLDLAPGLRVRHILRHAAAR